MAPGGKGNPKGGGKGKGGWTEAQHDVHGRVGQRIGERGGDDGNRGRDHQVVTCANVCKSDVGADGRSTSEENELWNWKANGPGPVWAKGDLCNQQLYYRQGAANDDAHAASYTVKQQRQIIRHKKKVEQCSGVQLCTTEKLRHHMKYENEPATIRKGYAPLLAALGLTVPSTHRAYGHTIAGFAALEHDPWVCMDMKQSTRWTGRIQAAGERQKANRNRPARSQSALNGALRQAANTARRGGATAAVRSVGGTSGINVNRDARTQRLPAWARKPVVIDADQLQPVVITQNVDGLSQYHAMSTTSSNVPHHAGQIIGIYSDIEDLVAHLLRRGQYAVIIGVPETHLEEDDVAMPLHGYIWFGRNRTTERRGGASYHGGVGMWVWAPVAHLIKIIFPTRVYAGDEGVLAATYTTTRCQYQIFIVYKASPYYCAREELETAEFWPALTQACLERKTFGPLLVLGDMNAQLRERQEAAVGCECAHGRCTGECIRQGRVKCRQTCGHESSGSMETEEAFFEFLVSCNLVSCNRQELVTRARATSRGLELSVIDFILVPGTGAYGYDKLVRGCGVETEYSTRTDHLVLWAVMTQEFCEVRMPLQQGVVKTETLKVRKLQNSGMVKKVVAAATRACKLWSNVDSVRCAKNISMVVITTATDIIGMSCKTYGEPGKSCLPQRVWKAHTKLGDMHLVQEQRGGTLNAKRQVLQRLLTVCRQKSKDTHAWQELVIARQQYAKM